MGIKDFFADRTFKHDTEVDKDYLKRCEVKIKELCGGIKGSDSFDERAKKYRIADRYTSTYERNILKYECKYGRLKYEDIENRLDELLQMDTITLLDIMSKEDSSKFKTQKDIEEYIGEGYVCKLKAKLRPKPLNPQDSNQKKNIYYGSDKQGVHTSSQVGKTTQTNHTMGIKQEQRINSSSHINSPKIDKIPKEKLNLIKRGRADIEIFTKAKSNTALVSAALFLATGVLVGEAKEEMKYVKTQLEIKNDRIIIKRPYIYHKYKDFRFFQVDQEDGYYLFYIGFSNEELIHFRTKEKYLAEIIMDKIERSGLKYHNVS